MIAPKIASVSEAAAKKLETDWTKLVSVVMSRRTELRVDREMWTTTLADMMTVKPHIHSSHVAANIAITDDSEQQLATGIDKSLKIVYQPVGYRGQKD